MTIPIYPALKGLSYIFRGNPFNKAISTQGVETRGFQLHFRANPFVVNQNFLIEIESTFQSSPSLDVVLELHSGSLEFYSQLIFDIPPIFPEIVNDFVFDVYLSLETLMDLEFPALEFSNIPQFIVDLVTLTPLPVYLDIEFYQSFLMESDVDSAIVLFPMFDSVGEMNTVLSILSPNFYDWDFVNGLEIELNLICLSSLYGGYESGFSFLNSITSQIIKECRMFNKVLPINEVEKNITFFNRVSPTQSYEYSGFYFSKIHGV